jgi:hypothetical protein
MCVDLLTNKLHCGACVSECEGLGSSGRNICRDGACLDCTSEGLAYCDQASEFSPYCASLADDPANCGACGQICESGQCADGACVDASGDEPAANGDAPDFADDLDLLGFVLSIERISLALDRQGLREFPASGDAFDGWPRDTRTKLGQIRDHEKAQVAMLEGLTAERGGALPAPVEYDFGFDDQADRFIAQAREVKEVIVSAYAGFLPAIADPKIAQALASQASVEGRHAAYLALLLREAPFPGPAETPRNRPDVLDALGGFLVAPTS